MLHLLLRDQIDRLIQNLDELARNHDGLESTVLFLTDRTVRLEKALQRFVSLQDMSEKTQRGYDAGTDQQAATDQSWGSIHRVSVLENTSFPSLL